MALHIPSTVPIMSTSGAYRKLSHLIIQTSRRSLLVRPMNYDISVYRNAACQHNIKKFSESAFICSGCILCMYRRYGDSVDNTVEENSGRLLPNPNALACGQ